MSPRLLLTPLLALAAWAYDFSALKPEGYVSDFARVVDPGSKAELERYCAAVERATGVQIALVTLPSLHGEPIEDVANLLYRKWGVGKKETNEGALLLLSIRDRQSRLEVGYGLEAILPDGSAGALLRQMRPALRANHIGDALKLGVREIGARVEQAKRVSIGAEAPPPSRVAPPGAPGAIAEFLNVGVALLMALVLFGLFARASRRRRYGYRYGTPWWLPVFAGAGGHRRPGSGSSHGGFGGYDSGDSFGGFGGGDSGGGGASSSW